MDDYLDRLVDISHCVSQLRRLYLTDLSSNGSRPELGGVIELLKTKFKPEDDEGAIVEEIKAKCRDPSLVITWKLVEEHIRQVMKEKIIRDTGSNWSRVIPEIRIERVTSRTI